MKTFNNEKEIKAYRFIKLDGSLVENSNSSTDDIIGVSDSIDSPVKDIADIYLPGEKALIEAGAAFNAGKFLTSDSEGRAIEAQDGDNIGAIALQDAASQGDIVEVIVILQRKLSTKQTDEQVGE